MDDRRFDSLTRAVASAQNRRTVLKGLLGLGGIALTGAAVTGSADAARRPTPTPKPVACPGAQHWDGTKCTCDTGTDCGPECCTGSAVCCDGACCNGDCYAEEQCCEVGSTVCHNTSCCVAGEVCLDDGSCCTPSTCSVEPPASLLDCGPKADGCGGSLLCACPENWLCLEGDNGSFCGNLTTDCLPGITAAAYGKIGLCDQGEGFCTPAYAEPETISCVSIQPVSCLDCTSDSECGTGNVCVQSWSEICPTQSMCATLLQPVAS